MTVISATSDTLTCTTAVFNYTIIVQGTVATNVCNKNSDVYRFGFNGKLKDNQYAGIGNFYQYGERMYSPWIGRPLTIDPLTTKFPMLSPYQFFSDNPIENINLNGLEGAPAKQEGGRMVQDTQHAWLNRNCRVYK